MRLQHFMACICLLLIGSACKEVTSNDLPLEKDIFVDGIATKLDSLVPELLATHKVPAVGVGIIEKGTLKFLKVYGEHQKGQVAPENTIFNIASITKPVVATAILKLVENGDWDLDAPLYPYWVDPDVAADSLHKKLTTRHCLSHTTGFRNWRWLYDSKKLQFDFPPGEKFQYSGEGMEYLRKAVENKFGIGLDKIVDSLVFKPLGMQDATMGWLQGKDSLRFAKWYNNKGDLHSTNYKIEKVNAADDMLVTVKDLALFAIAVLDKKLLTAETCDQMKRQQVMINEKIGQGLGWVVYDDKTNGEYILNHDGGDSGVAATISLFPKSRSGYILFANSDNGNSVNNRIIRAIVKGGKGVTEALYWKNDIPDTVTITQEKLAEYEGGYVTDRGFEVSFENNANCLVLISEPFQRLLIYPTSDDTFFPQEFELYFKFFEKDGAAKFQVLTQDGVIDLEGQKKE